MKVTLNQPDTIARPASLYASGVTVTDASTWMIISGQVGKNPDGSLAGDARAQIECCFSNIFAMLADASMDVTNLVKLTVFLTDPADVEAFREIRDRMLDGHLCASTLLIVTALASPDWVVEIEALAAA